MDKQLEAHLFGTNPLATVAQQSQTASSSMAPQVPDMGGFLSRSQKVYSLGRSATGVGGCSCSEAAQAVLGTCSHG